MNNDFISFFILIIFLSWFFLNTEVIAGNSKLNTLMFLNIGIISILDDECLRPGDATDHSFLEKLSQKLDGHKHYKSHRRSDIKTQKIMGRDVSTPDLEIIRNFLFIVSISIQSSEDYTLDFLTFQKALFLNLYPKRRC